ncbi:uncharacterized protein ARMOST_11982 [Armillaria ostoyae]|uniref:Fungal-type protein kinase domain-containing protein n=1 Tax=Armillaria ostoyae TaxID=47428 RepID=A0A284RIN8_ARMOS|nr:uncharacterized protein ARMOST_11982 [Armillaria ostoyae]
MTIKELSPTIPQLLVQFYQESMLPQVNSEDVDKILKTLVKRKSLLNGRWKYFPKAPSESEINESPAFEPMQDIWKDQTPPTIFMETRANENIWSDSNGGFKSDGHTRLYASRKAHVVTTNSTESGIHLHNASDLMACDLATIEEYAMRNCMRDLRDNVRKILGNAAQMLHSDPCRRFIRGTIVGNTSMRFWFFSRSHVFVMQAFNFISNPRPLIHYIVSLAFASLQDLGFDPTVRRVAIPIQESAKNEVQYAIHLSSPWANLISRGGRVWKVRRVGDQEDKYYALKDVWIAHDAMTEGEIQRSLFESIQNSQTDKEDFKRYFVEIEDCELVAWNDEVDKTSSFMRQPLPRHFQTFLLGAVASPDSSHKQVTGPTVGISMGVPGSGPRCLYTDKKHCRIVYREVGTPLDSLTRPGMVLRALDTARTRVDVQGWGSNITKITDIEYAKKFLSDPGIGDRKTGTAIFMPVQIQAETYLFLPLNQPVVDWNMDEAYEDIIFDEPEAERKTNSVEGTKDDSAALEDQASYYIPHNFLHDLESLWWIGEYALFSSVPASGKVPYLQRQITSYKNLFPHSSAGNNSRTMFLSNKDVHDLHIANLPREYTNAAKALSNARRFLKNQYLCLEANPDFPHVERSDFAPIYGLRSYFESAEKLIYIYETIPLTSHSDYPRLPSDCDQELMDDVSQVAKLTGRVLGPEVNDQEGNAGLVSQYASARDVFEDEAGVAEGNKARYSFVPQTGRIERPNLEFRTHDVPNKNGKRMAIS